MITKRGVIFGTVRELSAQIYADMKTRSHSAWDIGGYSGSLFECDDDVNCALASGMSVDAIVNDFEGWGGCEVLASRRICDGDTIIIGNVYGGGAFSSVVLPDGIDACEYYAPAEHWIDEIAKMLCTIMDAYSGSGEPQFDYYFCMEYCNG